MIQFDTDVMIWIQRSNTKAAQVFDSYDNRCISIITYMELMQSAPSQHHLRTIKDILVQCEVQVLPLSEEIGHRAAIYVAEYSLSHGIRLADALIAGTAAEKGALLITGNKKHFSPIKEINLKIFKP